MRRLFWVVLFCVAAGAAGAQTPAPIDFSGTWWNDRCSQMDLTVAGDDLTGTYTSAVGSGSGTPFPLRGYRSGVDLIAFVVNFGPASLATFAGQHTLVRGAETVVSMWHLTVNVADNDEEGELFTSVWTGADNFVRSKPSHCP